MQYRAFSSPSWSRSFWVASIAVALVAAFFVAALTPVTAHAQQPGQRPDFKVTQAQFDGRNLHVEYINATGIGYPVRRYEVGFQWHEARGEPLGVRHWLPVPAVERGGVSILDNRSRTELSYRSGRNVYGKRLSQFIAERPSKAIELRITVDDGDRIAEEDERNNTAFLKIPLPDIVLRDVKLTNDALTFAYANPTDTPMTGSFRIALQWMTPDGLPAGQEFSTQVGLTEPKEARQFPRYARELLYAGSGNSQTYLYASDFVRKRPSNAEMLRITIDPENAIAESNEQNNVENIFPTQPKSDLAIGNTAYTPDGVTLTIANRGNQTVEHVSLWFEWVDANEHRTGTLHWYDVPVTLRPTVSFTFSGSTRQLSSRAVDGGEVLTVITDVLASPPPNATHLKVHVDGPNAIVEAAEDNNTVLLPVLRPDLTIEHAELTVDRLSFNVKNAGTGMLPERPANSLWFEWADTSGVRVGDLYWYDSPVPLRPGVHFTWSEPNRLLSFDAGRGQIGSMTIAEALARAPVNATHFRVRVDGPNAITEIDEGNNVVLLKNPVVPRPDLTVTDLKLGDRAITWTLKNIGDTVSGKFHYEERIEWLDREGKTVNKWTTDTSTPMLRAGSVTPQDIKVEYEIPISFFIPPVGAVKLRVTVDPAKEIQEKDEGNNGVEIELPERVPDLTVSDLTLGKGVITWKLKNIGDTVSGKIYYSENIEWVDRESKTIKKWVTDTSAPILYAQEMPRSIQVDYGLPPSFFTPPKGAMKLRVWVDSLNTLVEKREDNNTAEISVARPDFIVSDLKLTKNAITWKEKNTGDTVFGSFTYFTQIAWLDASGAVLGERSIQAATVEIRAGAESTEEMSTKFGIPTAFLAPPSGAVKLRATVDAKGTVVEKDETNNAVEIKVEAAPEKLADLRIAEFTVDPIAPRAGERVWFIVRVENVGSAATGMQTATGIILDPEKSGTDRKLIGQFTAADIASGRSFTHRWTKENYYGWVAVAGTHVIEVCADRAKTISEGDETNNCTRKEVTVAVPVDERPKLPDLTIMDATLDTAALRFWYHNRGETATAPTISIWYEMVDAKGKRVGELRWINVNAAMQPRSKQQGNQLLDFATLDSERGTMTLGDFVNGAPPSATHLRLTIDGPSAHAEANEQNNGVLLPRPGVPKPDAAQPDLVLRDATLADGRLKVTIVNAGKGPAERVMWQFTWLGGKGEALATSEVEAAVGTLKSNASYPVELPYFNARPVGIFRFLQDMPDGAAALAIAVDPKNAIAESDEGNNTTRTALPGADLAIGAAMVRGDALIIPIVNHGTTASVATDLWLQWYGKGKWLPGSGAVDVPAVSGDATVEVKVPLNRSFGPDGKLLMDIPPTAERLRLFVDGLRKVPERNEQNNDRMVDRSVFPKPAEPEKPGKPDLVPEGLKIGPTSPTEGAMLDFSAVVRNKGTGKADASVAWFIVDFDRDDEPDVSPEPDDVKALAPNSVQTITWEDAVEAQAGTHAVEFCVDVEEAVDEANEDNNCVSRTFTVGSGAAAPLRARVVSPFRSILGAILSGLATPIVAGEGP